jgi:tetratricopeptide (TPR) repeat protein
MARSLDQYERMVKLLEDEPTLTAFGAATVIFDKCRRLLDKEPVAVKEWLDLERRSCQTIWGVFEPVFGQQDCSQEYRDFLLRHPHTALADDVYYRLGGCGTSPQRQAAYEKLLSAFPSSPLFAAALSDLEELHAKSGNDWLTARFAEELEKQPTHARDAPLLELEQAKVYGLALKRPDLAIPHLDAVISKHPSTEEWAEAQQVYATLCCNARRWADALAHIEALVGRRPDFEWVTSGEALRKTAECKEKLGQWLDAEKDYVQLILRRRDRFEVMTGKLLAEKLEKFTNAAKRELFAAHPEDFVRILPALKPVDREDLFRLLPGLKDLSEGKGTR